MEREEEEALDATPDIEAVDQDYCQCWEKTPQEGKRPIEEGGVTETTSNIEEVLLKLASVKYPIDPAHNQAVDLKCNASFVNMCVDRGLSTWS